MTPRTRKNPKPSRFDLDLHFERAARQIPGGRRPGLLAWLRRYRRRPERVFWVMDAASGRWRRV